ncbi:hypothetical protein [Streptomyces sp. NPDC002553]|uniref:hypothetical protein n=1 Tax=Streptomyces sp. NPDC002553 TaxID=3154417 RepID=UPI00332E1DC7
MFSIHSSVHSTPERHPGSALSYRPSKAPVRLSITARSKGSTWTVPLEVPVTTEGTA